jgi:hypothetical protein
MVERRELERDSPDSADRGLEPRERVRNLLIRRAEIMESRHGRNEGLRPRRRPSSYDSHDARLEHFLGGVETRHTRFGSLERALVELRTRSTAAREQIELYALACANGREPVLTTREAIALDGILGFLAGLMGNDIPFVRVSKWIKQPPPDEAKIEAWWTGEKSAHAEARRDRTERVQELCELDAKTSEIAKEIDRSPRQVRRILRSKRTPGTCLCGCGVSLESKKAGTKYHSSACRQRAYRRRVTDGTSKSIMKGEPPNE